LPDPLQDYSHRREWIVDRMRELAGLFAIEVCGYSVMSNHLHLVLRNRPDRAPRRLALGGAIELARRCRSAPFAALVPGQGGGSNRLCVAHWLEAEL
jgi:sugar phosphate isomerase/epimerase